MVIIGYFPLVAITYSAMAGWSDWICNFTAEGVANLNRCEV